jgi:hypothetical protein
LTTSSENGDSKRRAEAAQGITELFLLKFAGLRPITSICLTGS